MVLTVKPKISLVVYLRGLGPLLFLLYINDLHNISKKLLKFYPFADDTNIYFEACDLVSLEKIVNKELEKLLALLK